MNRNNKRDLQVLKFLWKFKVATTAMLYERYFSNISHRTAYDCIKRLQKEKLISIKTTTKGLCPVWELTKVGLKEIENEIPELLCKVAKSENHVHDLICNSIHLGPTINNSNEGIICVTEQMLRSVDVSILPEIIPSSKEHRPDGFWILPGGEEIKLMALEVELNQKSKKRYEELIYYYGEFPSDTRCLWIVKSKVTASTILSSLYKTRPRYYIHNFILLKDILKMGWLAPIFLGPNKKSNIHELINSNTPHKLLTDSSRMFIKYLLDNRLSYENHSVLSEKQLFSRVNSIGVSL
jgi:hypothetical protein